MSPARLADEAALSRLADLYARAVDRGDAGLLAALFTDDATLDFGAMFQGSRDHFVATITAAMAPMRTHHMMGGRLYAIDGVRAEGEIYSLNTHVIPGPDGTREYVAAGRYLDRYRRTAAGWRIAHRLRVIDWAREGPAEFEGAAGTIVGQRGGADASAIAFPLLAALGPG